MNNQVSTVNFSFPLTSTNYCNFQTKRDIYLDTKRCIELTTNSFPFVESVKYNIYQIPFSGLPKIFRYDVVLDVQNESCIDTALRYIKLTDQLPVSALTRDLCINHNDRFLTQIFEAL